MPHFVMLAGQSVQEVREGLMRHSKPDIACWLHLLGVWLSLVNSVGINWGNCKLAAQFMNANRVALTDRSWISFNVSTQDQ